MTKEHTNDETKMARTKDRRQNIQKNNTNKMIKNKWQRNIQMMRQKWARTKIEDKTSKKKYK